MHGAAGLKCGSGQIPLLSIKNTDKVKGKKDKTASPVLVHSTTLNKAGNRGCAARQWSCCRRGGTGRKSGRIKDCPASCMSYLFSFYCTPTIVLRCGWAVNCCRRNIRWWNADVQVRRLALRRAVCRRLHIPVAQQRRKCCFRFSQFWTSFFYMQSSEMNRPPSYAIYRFQCSLQPSARG